MMMLPKKIKILSIEYNIEYVDDPRAADWGDGEKARGSVCWEENTIKVLKANRPIQDIWRTIIHEVLHIINWDMNVDCADDEKYVSQVSTAFNCFLWENGILKKSSKKEVKNKRRS